MLKDDLKTTDSKSEEKPKIKYILGIHSNVGSGARFTDGHAWISVTIEGFTKTYSLWPDSHPLTKDNGKGSDVRLNMEAPSGLFNRYYSLSDLQYIQLNTFIKTTNEWFYTNNCSSWASAIVWKVLKVDIDADDFLGIETPREIGKSIQNLEVKEPTSLKKPKIIKRKK